MILYGTKWAKNLNFGLFLSENPPFGVFRAKIPTFWTKNPPSKNFPHFFSPQCSTYMMASVNKIKKTAVISQEDVVVTERENYSKVLLQKTCMMFPASKPNQISEKEIDIVDDSSR